MKAKTIKSILQKKHNDFLSSIEDRELRKLVAKNSIITGGCITSMLLNEPVNDYDYYFKDKETVIKVAEYYVKKFEGSYGDTMEVRDEEGRVKIFIPSKGVAGEEADTDREVDRDTEESNLDKVLGTDKELMEAEKAEINKYDPVFITSNAITLKGGIQLVVRFYGEPEEIHENYDFIHTRCYYTPVDKTLELPAKALEAIINKELVYVGSKYPLCSIFRAKKFINRGWQINAGQYLKMAMQLNDLDLLDLNVLEDQLVGVDTTYFNMLIDAIERQRGRDGDNFNLTRGYVITLINNIFG